MYIFDILRKTCYWCYASNIVCILLIYINDNIKHVTEVDRIFFNMNSASLTKSCHRKLIWFITRKCISNHIWHNILRSTEEAVRGDYYGPGL